MRSPLGRWLVIGWLGLTLVSCATAHKMNRLSVGMTKQQVIDALGQPASTSAIAGMEYLNYRFSETLNEAWGYESEPQFFVRLIDGKVESYGRLGDFDSTNTPGSAVNLNILQQVNTGEPR